jgi:hypothetical protein
LVVSDDVGSFSFGSRADSEAIFAELRGFPTFGFRMDDAGRVR